MKLDKGNIIRAMGLENLTQIFWKDEIKAYTTNEGNKLEVKTIDNPQPVQMELSTRLPYTVLRKSYLNKPAEAIYYLLSPFQDTGIDARMQGILFAIQYFKNA